MGLKTQLTSEERAQILLLRRLNPNWPGVRIGQEIGRSTATVNRFLANPEDYGRKPPLWSAEEDSPMAPEADSAFGHPPKIQRAED